MKIKQKILNFTQFIKDYNTKFTFKYACITIIILQFCFIFSYNHWVNPDWISTKHFVKGAMSILGEMLKHLSLIYAFDVLWNTIVGFFEIQLHFILVSFLIWVLIPIRYYLLYRKFKFKTQQTESKIKRQNTQQALKTVNIQEQLKEAPRRGKSTLS